MSDAIEIRRNAPEPDVVAELERLLAHARRGDLVGFVMVARLTGGDVERVRIGLLDRIDVIAYAEMIKHDSLHSILADE